MPEIIIVAGPNGAGKTTFANAFLPLERERFVYVNADEIAQELYDPCTTTSVRNIQAGREMLDRIEATISAEFDLMFETTLATRAYAQEIPVAEDRISRQTVLSGIAKCRTVDQTRKAPRRSRWPRYP
jgi:predicted ABC-type ATPase